MRNLALVSALATILLVGALTPSVSAALGVATDKSQYLAGDNLTVIVSGGVANFVVQLQFNSPSGAPLWVTQGVFSTSGTFSYTIKVPAGWPTGTWTVLAMGGGVGGQAQFQIVSSVPIPPTNSPPSTSISGPSEAIEGDSVTFSGSGSSDTDGTVVGYFWTWGDGGEGVGASASHTYAVPGTYTVSLRVTDDDGASGTASATITVKANQAPTASISGAADGKINEAVSFTGAGVDVDGTIASYAWTFGDGGTGSGASATHTYTVAGTYTVTLTVTDNKGKTGSATTSVRIYNPPPPVEEIKQDTPADAAAKLEETLPADAAVILEELPAQSAANIVEELKPETAAAIIVESNAKVAAQIVEKMTPETAAKVVEAAVTGAKTEEISTVLLTMNDQDAANVLVDTNTAVAAQVVESMANQDLNEAAKTVEDTIKLFINQLDPTTRAEVKKHVKETLENVTVESLVKLFIEIANLPNTPSTVATMFETFELGKTLDLITGIGELDAWTELGNVFGYLSQGSLGTIYSAMPSAQRASLSPHLSAQTVALLPKIGTYQVSALAVTPATAAPGATVSVTATVRNVGAEAGTHDVVLKVNGATAQTKTVALNAGQSATVSYTLTAGAAGTYSVTVESQSASFKIVSAAADISVTGVTLSKTSVASGEQVTATVTLGNAGDASGEYALTVTLDGVQKFSESVTVEAGQTATKTCTLSSTVVGSHTVAAGGKTAQFAVAAPPPTWTDYIWWIIGAVVVIAAVAYYFLVMRKKA